MAWIYRARPRGNFYLASRCNGRRVHRPLKTANRRQAERELLRVRAAERAAPLPSGRIRWRRQYWEQFTNLSGQTRMAKQGYALAVAAIRILSADPARFAYLLSPVPRTATLSELARIQSPDIIMLAADEICEKRMASKPAIRLLRLLRGTHRRYTQPAAA